jgi:lipid-A-disaccharide synthase-like uncharacterized protein
VRSVLPLGFLLFVGTCFVYLRYASSNLHVEERVQHARILKQFWVISFYGSLILLLFSLLGLGRSRWVGVILNGGALIFTLMTLGAMCGPNGC